MQAGIISLMLFAVLFWPAQAGAQQAAPPTVSVAKPIVRQVVEDDEFVGRFEAVDEVSVRSRVGGYLDAVHFKDGALVAKGDLLVTIDQRPFQTVLAQAQAQLDIAQSQVDYANAQFKRTEKL
jgi:membrane fusion protein, multidrug efflux system